MRILWKVLLGLALVVPMGAYVAGALAASSADSPAPRETIVIRDNGDSSTRPARPATPDPSPTASTSTGVGRVELDPDDLDSHDDDWGREDDHVGEDHTDDPAHDSDDDHGGDRRDDNSGHGSDDGGGQDDHSGPGGGGGDD